jgi:lipopolysaccharide export system protein LptA
MAIDTAWLAPTIKNVLLARFMPFIKILRTLGLLASGWGAWGMPAWAEKADRDQAMRIEADAMRHDENKRLTVFTGQVLAFKGTMQLRGARLEVQQDPQGQQTVRIWAAPNDRVFFRQKREGVDEYTEGEGEIVSYDSQADVVTLSQRAELRVLRGTVLADQISGQKIVFNNTTEVVTVDGLAQGSQAPSPADQRVRAVLTPRKTSAVNSTPTTPPVSPRPALTLQLSPNMREGQKP